MEIAYCFISAAILTAYFLFLMESRVEKPKANSTIKKLKVVIPFRNERNRIEPLLHDLLREFARVDNVQVFFVNDGSTDASVEFIEDFLAEKDLHFLVLPSFGNGKKSAIETASQFCSLTDFILTLDADVTLQKGYGQELLSLIPTDGLNVLTLDYPSPKNVLESLIKLESLFQKPLFLGNAFGRRSALCSGAHLLYPAHFFEHIQPYQNNKEVLSGDDMFFLDKCLTGGYKTSSHAITVRTQYPNSWKAMFRQRRRWLSKSSKLESKYYHRFSFLFALLLVSPLAMAWFNPLYALLFLAIRVIFEVLFFIKEKAFSFQMILMLPLFWLFQYSMPLLYIFGRRQNEQTW